MLFHSFLIFFCYFFSDLIKPRNLFFYQSTEPLSSVSRYPFLINRLFRYTPLQFFTYFIIQPVTRQDGRNHIP